jgi:hypothetical protein
VFVVALPKHTQDKIKCSELFLFFNTLVSHGKARFLNFELAQISDNDLDQLWIFAPTRHSIC